jgi:hypothetical protein
MGKADSKIQGDWVGVSYGKHTFKKQKLWLVNMLFLSVKKNCYQPCFWKFWKSQKGTPFFALLLKSTSWRELLICLNLCHYTEIYLKVEFDFLQFDREMKLSLAAFLGQAVLAQYVPGQNPVNCGSSYFRPGAEWPLQSRLGGAQSGKTVRKRFKI